MSKSMSKSMRTFGATMVTVLLAGIVVWGLVAGEPSQEDRVRALGSQIRCPVCQGESITDSPSGFARDMLAFVEDKVEEGWSDEQILTYFEDRFPGSRLDPGFRGTTLLLWLLPAAAGAAGIAAAWRRTRRSAPGEPGDGSDASPSDVSRAVGGAS